MTDVNSFLFHLINGVWINPVLDLCMTFLSLINDYGLVWLMLLAVLAALGGRTGRWAALVGLVALVAGLISSEVLKNLVMQPRPFLSLSDVRLLVSPPSSYSFPSVNVAYAFAASSGRRSQPGVCSVGCHFGVGASWPLRPSSPTRASTWACTTPATCWAGHCWGYLLVGLPRLSLTGSINTKPSEG